MKTKIIIFFLAVSFLFMFSSLSYALNWKKLHEDADRVSITKAITAATIKPDSINDLYILGLKLFDDHQDKEAEVTFNKILSLDPSVTEAKWGVAEAFRREHNIEKSQKLIDEVLKVKPDFAPARITLAYIKYTNKQYKETIELAQKVIDEGRDRVDLSNYTRAYLLIGGARGMIAQNGGWIVKIANGTQVLPNLKKAEKLEPDSPAVLFGLGSFYFLAPTLGGGNIDKARDYLERAVDKDPLFADAYVRLAQVYQKIGDADKFYINISKVVKLDPKNQLLEEFKKGKYNFVCVSIK